MAVARPVPAPRELESINKNKRVGAWRSLVAHLHGVQGVPSSNLGAPTSLSGSIPVTSVTDYSDGMDVPLHNGIKRAKVVVSASHLEEERPR